MCGIRDFEIARLFSGIEVFLKCCEAFQKSGAFIKITRLLKILQRYTKLFEDVFIKIEVFLK
jgi:hypothetical protein